MLSRERKIYPIRKVLLLLAMLMTIAGFSAVPSVTAQAAKSDPNVVQIAKKNSISSGKWVKKGNKLRYKKQNGKFVKSRWCMIDGAVYYFNAKGYVQTGSIQYRGAYYYANAKGKLCTNRFVKRKGKVYYYDSTGARVHGRWKKIGGKTYYFDRTGQMITNSWVGNSYVGKNGAKVYNKTVQGRKIDKSGNIKKLSKKDTCIFVGASRVVDLSMAANGTGTAFIAKDGQGISWLKGTASVQLKAYLKKNPRCTVVFMMGHNDLKQVNAYIKYYRSLIKKYPKATFYFVDLLPKTKEQTKVRKARVKFNRKMNAAFGNRCINAEAYLKSQGCLYETLDGTHYPAEVSSLLYQYIMRQIKGTGSADAGENVTQDMVNDTYDMNNQTG